MNIIQGLTFDDVLLVPQHSNIKSRFSGEIDLSTKVAGIELEFPVISANMNTVTEDKMVDAMYVFGGLGIIHRYLSPENHLQMLKKTHGPKVLSIGASEEEFYGRLIWIQKQLETTLSAILIDVAHAHHELVTDQISLIKRHFLSTPVIAGNIATAQAASDLFEAGADCVKVGIGGGSMCTSRLKTGCGVPQLTAIKECVEVRNQWYPNRTIIADGGIKGPGDIVKALAVGADAVMIGKLLAGTSETPGEIEGKGPGRQKIYQGMASRKAQEEWRGRVGSVEGKCTYVRYQGETKDILEDIRAGILSGFSYCGARNIQELRKKARFIQQTSAGQVESRPHGVS